MNMTHTLTHPKQNIYSNFSTNLRYFKLLAHRSSTTSLLNHGQKFALHLTDLFWYKKMGPKGLADLQQMVTKTSTALHTGLIKTYLGSFALSILGILLTLK